MKQLKTSQKVKFYEIATKVLKIATWGFIAGGLVLGAVLVPTVSLAAALISAFVGTVLGVTCKSAGHVAEVYRDGYRAEYTDEQKYLEQRAKEQEFSPHEITMPEELKKEFEQEGKIIINDKYEVVFPNTNDNNISK